MLLKFEFSNLYSYKDNACLDFTYHSRSSNIGKDNTIAKYREVYRDDKDKRKNSSRTIKVLNGNIVYGANASGKTNLISALRAFQIIVLRGDGFNRETINLPTFKFTDQQNNKVRFNIRLLNRIDNSLYKIEFGLVITKDFIIDKEFLSYSKISDKTGTAEKKKVIFNRTKRKIISANRSIRKIARAIEADNIDYSLILTKLVKGINRERFKNELRTIEYKVARSTFNEIVHKFLFINLARSFSFSEEKRLKRKLEEKDFKHNLLNELRKFDFSIRDIEVKEYPREDKDNNIENELSPETRRPYFLTKHEVKGREYTLSYRLESKGTHNFIRDYIYLFDAMKTGKFVIIDEFETSYHPELQEELLYQLLNNAQNNNNFQFLLTTHNTHYMNPEFFSKEQINFVDKDYKTQISDIYKLSDYPDVSYNDDWERLYREHRLGGVPNIE